MIQTNEFRKGLKIEYEGGLWAIVEAQHVKPGKGVAFVKTRIKNMLDGTVRDINFRSGDKVGRPDVNEVEMQVLYADNELGEELRRKRFFGHEEDGLDGRRNVFGNHC